jgi:hypothetical protein
MRRYQLGLLACTLPVFVLSLALTGCGGEKDKPKTTDASSGTKDGAKEKATGKAEPLEGGTGVVKGKVTVKVDDSLKTILARDNKEKLTAAKLDAKSVETCLAGDMSQQAWKVSDQGGVKNVFVWLIPPRGKFFAVDPSKVKLPDVTIDQPQCAFIPHAAWVMPSFKNKEGKTENSTQKLIVKNSAPIGHNTKWGDASQTQGDNLTIEPGSEKVLPIKASREVITLSCSIHGWMTGYIWAVDHPYVAITDEQGNFKIEGVPTGTKLNIVAWHEGAEYITGKPGDEIEVKDGENEKNFEIPAGKVK